MTHYRRRRLKTWEEAAAIAAGALVGLGVTYLGRIWLSRAPLGRDARREAPPEEGPGRGETVPTARGAGPAR